MRYHKKARQPLIFISMLFVCIVLGQMTPSVSAMHPGKVVIPYADYRTETVEISLVEIASGIDAPIQVTHAGDGSNRLFVVEQSGRVRIIKNNVLLPDPYLDISTAVLYGGERGLLGLAFHPQFTTNGYFYVNYTRAGDGATVIARYQTLPVSSDTVDAASGSVLLTIPQPYANHNGGQLTFSPVDGYLYIGMGDGGSGGDPLNSGQDSESLLGAMLRIDVDGDAPYAVPPDNPFIDQPGRDEIWATGLRNPWRFSFDRSNGDMYIGDVGQNEWEEVSFQQAGTPGGINFGWRCKEGTHDYNFTGNCLTEILTDPIAEYSHADGSCITGGFVYRGADFPALYGLYFFADYVNGKIWSMQKTSTDPIAWSQPQLMLDTGLNISAFGEDEAGELYVAAISQQSVFQLVDVNGPVPNLSSSTKIPSSPSADPGEIVTYTISLLNTGGSLLAPIYLTDTIPSGLAFTPGSFQASSGVPDESMQPILHWQGNLQDAAAVTLTYQVQVVGDLENSIINTAIVDSPATGSLNLASALFVPKSPITSTQQDFVMPGTQPGSLNTPIQSSVDCNICHTAAIYDKWRGSMMSQAGRDPLFWSALSTANIDAPESGEICLRCHLTTGLYAGRSHLSDGSALTQNDIANGVACHLCHRMVDPVPSTSDEAMVLDLGIRSTLTMTVPANYIGGATLIVDPQDNRRGPFSFASSLPYHTAYQTDYLGQTSDAITRARVCGSCHNVDNPVLQWDPGRGQYWPNQMDTPADTFDGQSLFPVERTFDEWTYSQYAKGGVVAPQFAGGKADKIVSACQDCHLPRQTGTAADAAFNPVFRDCDTTGCLPEHTLVGGNTWIPQLLRESTWRLEATADSAYLVDTEISAETMLRKAATLTVTLETSGTNKIATVRVMNHTGHKLPTGYPEGRQIWLNLQAYDSANQLVYESGNYDFITGQLHRDADAKVYEVKQGITPELAALVNQPAGESFHFVLNNTVVKDNRIPPVGVLASDYDWPGLRPVQAQYADGQNWDDTIYVLPGTTARVLVTLYYQTASREYIDFLRVKGGIDGLALGQLWDASRSPPVVMAKAWFPDFKFYLPVLVKE